MAETFRHRLRVRFNECDPQGVVFYANYLMYLDVALTEFWRELLGSYSAMVEAGVDMMVAEANIRYHAPARFGDELDLLMRVARIGTTSSVLAIDVERAADGARLAEGELRHVFVGSRSLEKVAIPARLRNGLARYHPAPAGEVSG